MRKKVARLERSNTWLLTDPARIGRIVKVVVGNTLAFEIFRIITGNVRERRYGLDCKTSMEGLQGFLPRSDSLLNGY